MRKFISSLLALALLAVQAAAGNMLIDPYKVAVLDPTVSVTFIGCSTSDSDLTTYTFNTVNTGPANAYRKTIVGIVGEDTANTFSVSSVTVDGDAASIAIASAQGFTINAGLAVLANPSGTSETVAVTWDEAVTATTICVWSANNLSSLTPTSTAAGQAGTSGSPNLSIDVSALGIAVGICGSPTSPSVTNWSWTGMTERLEVNNGTEFTAVAADYQEDASASAPLSAVCSSAGNQKMGVSASFL